MRKFLMPTMRNCLKISAMLIFASSLFLQINSFSQKATFGPVAEGLQNSAHNLFYNNSGPYYNQNNNGHVGFNYWWNSHGIDAFMDGYLRTRNSVYLTRSKALLRGIKVKNGNTYSNNYVDDMEWLAISSLRAYEITKDSEYLTVAETLWGYIKNGFHGNSFRWKMDCPNCRNTCANTPAVIFAARLYRLKGNAADLQIARDVFAWVKSTLVDPTTGAVWDAYDASSGSVDKARYSYNQGTYIGAALELYQLTSEQTYMDDAIKTADYASSNSINGILYPNSGGGDGGLFNGILVRYLALLAREGNIPQAKKNAYNQIMLTSATALKNQGINYTTYTASSRWGVPPEGGITDYASQLSAVMLAEVASSFDQVGVYQDIHYGGNYAHLAPGSYTLTQLEQNGILNDYITAITIPAGYRITVYENDNFSGASTVYTSNQAWLGNWNDRISSLVISPNSSTFNQHIEAESYGSMSGVQTESCTEGGLNAGYIDTSDWMAYNNITIPASGNYIIEYRIASPTGGKLSLDINAGTTVLGMLDIPATGGWQAWTTLSHTVYINAGTYNFGVYAQTGGWNFNWWNIKQQSSAASTSAITDQVDIAVTTEEKPGRAIYPNPASGNVQLTFSGEQADIIIKNAHGYEVMPATIIHPNEPVDISHLERGVYFIQVEVDGIKRTERLIKQ